MNNRVKSIEQSHPWAKPQLILNPSLFPVLYLFKSVLRIRDVYSGSEFYPSRIPDLGSRVKNIPGYSSASKNLSILTYKIVSKLAEI